MRPAPGRAERRGSRCDNKGYRPTVGCLQEGGGAMRRSPSVSRWRGARQMGRWPALICTVLMLAAADPAAAVAPPVKVRDRGSVNELQPSMSEDGLVWAQGAKSFVKPESDPKVRLNPAGTASFFPAIDDSTVVYNVFKNDDSNLKMYDIETGERSSAPHAPHH